MIRPPLSEAIQKVAIAITIAIIAFASSPAQFATAADGDVDAAVLSSASLRRYGGSLDVLLEFRAEAPRWTLTTHGNELWLDFNGVQLDIPPRPLLGRETSPISFVRAIPLNRGGVRVVVGVEGKTDYAVARAGSEVVIRVATAGRVPNLAASLFAERELPATEAGPASDTESVTARMATQVEAAPEPHASRPPVVAFASAPDASKSGGLQSVSAEHAPGHPIVMIDPGHGGYDPGTLSETGVAEKDLALQIALRVKQALEGRGVRAEMTRASDVFISLPERTRLANQAGADLFVSIHLNSSPNEETTGIEVYYLNNTTDRATIRLAAMENGAAATYSTQDGANLNYILSDLRQQYKAQESASLARMIDTETVANLEAGLGISVNALGARMGPFYVLVGAQMPAVLVEGGFLSNRDEARRLQSAQYQELLADGIASSVVRYLNADVAVGDL
ncbi:MAG TPA: N-acetylmuramoyl-L-alanine amidase [Candidatus Binataceae bacterium]